MLDWFSLIKLLIQISTGSALVLTGIIWSRGTKFSSVFWPLPYYLACDALLYIADTFLKRVFHNNIAGFHVSTLSDVTWLTLIFILLASGRSKKWLKVGWLLFLVTVIISAVWLDGLLTNINTLSRIWGNAFLVLMALRHLSQMTRHERLLPPSQSPSLIFCITILLYYSTSLVVFLGQDLPRYDWFKGLSINLSDRELTVFSFLPYPLLRAIQFGLLLHLITLFPMGVTPRHALPRWLRFRIGWRPPTKNWRYRVLPPHLVG